MSEKQISFKKIDAKLQSVQYQSLENMMNTYSINYTDQVELKSFTDIDMEIIFKRHLFLEPRGVFDIGVEFIIQYIFIDQCKGSFLTKEEANQFYEKNKKQMLEDSQVGSKASLLIAQLTSFQDLKPIIVPPMIKIKDK